MGSLNAAVPLIKGETRLLGVMGWPVAHSLSPVMHNAALAHHDLPYVYVPLPVAPAALSLALAALPMLGFRGVNLTVPHKQAALPFLTTLEPAAAAIGAANTLVFEEATSDAPAQVVGYNTDWRGFAADLAALGVVVARQTCLVLGAGGAARAVVYALLKERAIVRCFARRQEQAQALVLALSAVSNAPDLTAHPWSELPRWAADAAVIINATPLGMGVYLNQSPWPADLPWPPAALAYDLIYRPARTLFLAQAQAAGGRTANGLGMLLRQGALAWPLWLGITPEQSVMAAALDAALSLSGPN